MRTLVGALALTVTLTAAGAVARQALHLNDGPAVGWRCPTCGSGNAGHPNVSFHAVCRRCSKRRAWNDITQPTAEASLSAGATR